MKPGAGLAAATRWPFDRKSCKHAENIIKSINLKHERSSTQLLSARMKPSGPREQTTLQT